MKYHISIIITAILFCTSTHAQIDNPRKVTVEGDATSKPLETSGISSHQSKTWDKEPENFLGIVIGKDFSVQACPTRNVGQTITVLAPDFEAIQKLSGVCHIPQSPNRTNIPQSSYKIINLPALGIPYSTTVRTEANSVKSIVIKLKQENFGVLVEAFTQRYGQPTSVIAKSVGNKFGAEFSAQEIKWRGKNISIYMYERFNLIDKSYVLISNNATIDAIINNKPETSEVQKF